MAPEVARLFEACPFLEAKLDTDDVDLPTVIFGSTARLLRERGFDPTEEDAIFGYFNSLAEQGSGSDLEILGTGAIELFNDNAEAQRLARAKLTGPALQMLEKFREYWGQHDYGPAR